MLGPLSIVLKMQIPGNSSMCSHIARPNLDLIASNSAQLTPAGSLSIETSFHDPVLIVIVSVSIIGASSVCGLPFLVGPTEDD